ncbi:MAG: cytochrome P450, partial [Gammaproteobacteria bacterium]|nr:cytochrome P450 [Gammaproteobacteria bacterium]
MNEALFTPRSAATWRDPYPMYAALREHDPVHHVTNTGEGEDYYVLSRFEDIFAAGVDGELYTSTKGITPSYNDMALHRGRELPIVMMDGPEHIELRQTILERFKPARLAPLQQQLRDFIVDRLEQFRVDGGGDMIVDLCKPLPSLFVSRMLGVPLAERTLFDDWAWKVASASATGELMAAGDAVMEMVEYFGKLLAARRKNPEDDLVSDLAHAMPASGVPLSDEKILGVCFTMVLGGNDTATGLLGGTAEILTAFPDQRAQLLSDPSLIKNAIEEFLRLTSPVQGLARTATRDITLH